MKDLAPIVLFVYKRPEMTLKVLKALSENEHANESKLYVYCDGPKKNESYDNRLKIEETRKIVKQTRWCSDIEIIEREENIGLANSIISGVSEIVEKHKRAIVLEDDIITSPFFLMYMNQALNLYENDRKVLSIGACNFFAKDKKVPETFFIPIPDCWGWATWDNRWRLFEKDSTLLLKLLTEKGLMERFNLYGRYNFEKMLIDQVEGKNNSWAIRWQAVAYTNDMLSLYPKFSVIKNIGYDEGATNGNGKSIYDLAEEAPRPIMVTRIEVKENELVNKLMMKTYSNLFGGKRLSFLETLKSKLRFLKNV